MKSKDYKPQIDGLRALAVLPVIFFHAGFDLFKGGFIGVDIFFVISGYLITNLILKDLSEKKFSIFDFYIRRSRRILPALFVVTFFSTIVAIFLMTSEELKFFSKQSISVVLFLSNFFFWKNTGYFDPNSDLQPLLHTWSLGVEEQYYIFFPIFLILIWNFFRKKLIISLITIILISLAISQFGGNFKIQNFTNNYPFFKLPFEFFWQAGSGNFYLPFGRIWELLLGSLASIVTFKKNYKIKKTDDLYSFIGVCLIIFSIIFFSKDLQYPSFLTILPVMGTLLIILYTNKSTLIYRVLSLKPLVFLGLISFSLYLWHQPLLAFNRIYFGINLPFSHTLLILLITFFVSILSWKFIETPFRKKKQINNKQVIVCLLTSAFIILLFSFLIFSSQIKSFQRNLPKEILQSFKKTNPKNCFDINYAHIIGNKWYCELGDLTKDISFVVIGDSHALTLKPPFDFAGKQNNKKGILVGFSGCPGLLGVNSIRSDANIRNCRLLNEKLFKFVKKKRIEKIFLVSRWTYYTVGNQSKTNFNLVSKNDKLFSNINESKKSIVYGIKKTIEKYKKIGSNVVFVNQVPEQIYDPKHVYRKSFDKINNKIDHKKLNNFSLDLETHIRHQKFMTDNLKAIQKLYPNLKKIDFDRIFCNKVKCFYGTDNSSYYADKNHLSITGAMKTKNKIMELLN